MKIRVFLLLSVLLVVGCSDPQPLNVKGMQTDIKKYQKDAVIIEGVVSSWRSQDPQLFAIADVTEASMQKQFVVPVRFSGQMPHPGELVRVTGKIDIAKKEFVATKVKRM